MRDVVLRQYAVSLDGFSCADDSEFQRYVFDLVDPELDEQIVSDLRRAGTHIMGRVTYNNMADYWPETTGAIADVMNHVPKVVFSGTLEHAPWAHSSIASGDTAQEIARLKSQPGAEIMAHGGFRFTQSLVRLDLVDELRLYVFPVALGHGSSIFTSVESMKRYQLVSSVAYSCGAVFNTLRRIERVN